MARKIRYGLVRNGEHLKIYSLREDAEAAANVERRAVQKAADDGWTIQRSADETHVFVEEIRGYIW